MYVNVGAKFGITDMPTKTTLKRMMKENPADVTFYETSAFGHQHEGDFTGAELKEGLTYSVCGPNAFRDRRWYATVKLENGKIKVM